MSPFRALSRTLGTLALALGTAVLLTTCDSGKSKSPAKESAASEALIEEADALLSKARKAGVDKSASEAYLAAKKLLDDAATLDEEGEAKKAASKRKRALASLKGLIQDQEQVTKEKAKLADLKKAVDEAKKKADAAKASEVSPDAYREAMDELAAAKAGIDKATSPKELAGPGRSLARAKERFEEASRTAVENESFRSRAEEERKEVARVKELAKSRGAEEKAPQEWLTASQGERDAEASMKSGSFRQAVDQFKQTVLGYQNALAQVTGQEEMQKMMAENAEAEKKFQEEAEKAEKERIETAKAELAIKKKEREATKAARGKAREADAVPAVVLFDGYDPAAYPQELDEEDTIFLNDHIGKLSDAGVIAYDPDTFAVVCNYTVGRDVRKDNELIGTPLEHINYESPMMQGQNVKQKQVIAEYSFEGNTLGTILFPVPFRYYVRAQFSVGIVTMDAGGLMGVLAMYDKKKKSGYKSQWMAVGTTKKLKPRGGKYDKAADTWHIKFRPVPYHVEYQMPDTLSKKAAGKGPLETGRFVVKYDVTTKDEAVNSWAATTYTRGQFGFWWDRTKFQVYELEITGILDREAAVAKLREKTGLKKSGGAAEKKPAKKPAETAKGGRAKAADGSGAGGNGGEPEDDAGAGGEK